MLRAGPGVAPADPAVHAGGGRRGGASARLRGPLEEPSANLHEGVELPPQRRSAPALDHPERRRRPAVLILLLGLLAPAPASAAVASISGLLELSLEELGQIEVTSVSRRPEPVSDAAAAVYVITREAIRRSGVTTLPEALRLAPGVEVARNGAHAWTITMRGFSSDLSNKLLVLIDGRSVYSPLFAGVYWDVQSTLLEDVDRIEVIAGPGGTTWGANAVNGVINIITRSAWESPGGYAEVGVGDEHDVVAGFRYGGRLGDNGAARGYVKHFERDASRALEGGAANDDWDFTQAGFRSDWVLPDAATLTVQGDVYEGEESALVRSDFTLGTLPEENVPGTVEVGGGNLLARWERALAPGSLFRVQAYYDHTRRDIPGTFDERRHTGDLEIFHDLRPLGRHDVTWGAGWRVTGDDVGNTRFATFDPSSRTDHTYSLFLQDQIGFRDDRLRLTVGTKLEHNDYSGFEHQPNLRLAWLPTPGQIVWGAVSRAVRVPARLNEDLELYAPVALPGVPVPLYINVRSPEDVSSEELVAYELGYRFTAGRFSADAAMFYNDYDKLMTNEALSGPFLEPGPPPYLVLPVVQGNGMRGETWGGTLDLKWQPHPSWRLELQLSHIDFDLELRPGSRESDAPNVAGNSPELQAALYSYLQLPRGISLFAGARYVDELPGLNIPSYVAVDTSLQWQLDDAVAVSLTLRNLNDPRHPEFEGGNEIERSALFRLTWRF